MNIAYKGRFLREGLLQNGHHVHDIKLGEGQNLQDALNAAPVPIDLVIWELFGGMSDLQALTPCDQPIAAYCIDTPLNEFWLKNCVRNMDFVFVDQQQCVPTLSSGAGEAAWLPLPAQQSYFQPQREKSRDITFIGTTNSQRVKRNNILKLLGSRYSVDILSGLDMAESQKIFSESRIVLNENFFPGLTLRVVQGLAAGSIVYTERSPYGHDFGLRDGRDLLLYDPQNILDRIGEVLQNYGDHAAIGRQGQERCRELFDGGRVAAELLSRIGLETRRKPDPADALWNRLTSEVLFVQRFGGSFASAMRDLEELARSSSGKAAAAHVLMGDLKARTRRDDAALAHYRKALEITPGSVANLKLALLAIRRDEPASALRSILAFLRHWPRLAALEPETLLAGGVPSPEALLTVIATLFYSLGQTWDMGFNKDFADPVPDTAFEVARMSFERAPTAAALELMLKCLRPAHMQGELLPLMLTAIKRGLLSDARILDTARLAFEYYDRDTAAVIMAAMRGR
ncbi:glycosyltransferase [Desulfovibrio sp.]|uniref:glycosyltransferase family protein n=1 Tax=Desulfovibrio sp. TaxID=885 RepID=UPI0023D02D10|nr:glycosyltransferase [Desulfovibrio sp.]MDE7242173.1 glycosyltransferase [Desulfovibrio sp.]